MKEYSLPLRDTFSTGLRAEEVIGRNIPSLVTAYNAYPTKRGLERFRPFDSYLPHMEVSWPFPQLFLMKGKTFVGTANGLYEYVESLGTYQIRIAVQVVDPWAMLDFSPFFICINESRMWTIDLDTDAFVEVDYRKFPRPSAITNFKGQLIVGGDIAAPGEFGDVQSYRSRVSWGRIGSMDFTVGRNNQAGFMELDAGGAIRNVFSLDSGFVVYSTRQIVYFPAVTSPVPTFGKQVLYDMGVPYKGSVCKGKDEHLLLTYDGELHRVNSEGISSLGYREYFDDFKKYRAVITYNPYENEYYISNGLRTYVYRKEGLGEIGQIITSGGLTYEGEYVVQAKESLSQDYIVVTDTFDFSIRGMKTLYAVEVTANAGDEMEMSIFWRSDVTQGFRQTKWARLGPSGVATIPTSGIEFRLAFRSTGSKPVYLDTAIVRWKLTDKRPIRGQYVDKTPS